MPTSRRTVLIVLLCLVPTLGLVALVVGAYTLISFGPGESAAPALALVDSAPAPAGAVRYEHTSHDGSMEVGPSARVAYRLPASTSAVDACVDVVAALRSQGWELDTWGESPTPLPQDQDAVTAVCADGVPSALVLEATRPGSDDRFSVVVNDTGRRAIVAYAVS